MALITVAAAKGSPGVTTTSLAMGALWPRQVLVAECDASGADVPLRMSAEDGGVLDADRGLLSLAAAGRKGLSSDLVLAHSQRILGGLDVMVGPRVPEQAAGLTNLWPLLGPALDGLPGYDVLADCGRIGTSTPQSALIRASRLFVIVCTTEPSSVIHTRERLLALAPSLDPTSPVGTPIAVVVVGEPKARDAVAQVRESLERTEIPLQAVWHLAHDPKGAGFFKGHLVGRADKTLLVKTARPVVEHAAGLVEPFFEALPDEAPVADGEAGAWGDFSFAEQTDVRAGEPPADWQRDQQAQPAPEGGGR
jgi:MinD-like ATPase involved in chromosome partitioning or flagellar assembly